MLKFVTGSLLHRSGGGLSFVCDYRKADYARPKYGQSAMVDPATAATAVGGRSALIQLQDRVQAQVHQQAPRTYGGTST